MKRTYEEVLEAFSEAENTMAELQALYIDTHKITSRDGCVPQSFDEIGDEELRELARQDLVSMFPEEVREYETLKAELAAITAA